MLLPCEIYHTPEQAPSKKQRPKPGHSSGDKNDLYKTMKIKDKAVRRENILQI